VAAVTDLVEAQAEAAEVEAHHQVEQELLAKEIMAAVQAQVMVAAVAEAVQVV
jgi:hypothetical protein